MKTPRHLEALLEEPHAFLLLLGKKRCGTAWKLLFGPLAAEVKKVDVLLVGGVGDWISRRVWDWRVEKRRGNES